jgi:hypothetical protein
MREVKLDARWVAAGALAEALLPQRVVDVATCFVIEVIHTDWVANPVYPKKIMKY